MATTTTRALRQLTLALAVTAAVVLTSCSQSETVVVATTTAVTATTATASATSGATPSPTNPPPSTPAGRRIEIIVTGKQVKPQPATVDIAVGESLTITITSDKANTMHGHGFEIAKAMKAGEQVSVTIKGARSGVFEFELHDPALKLFQVAVR